MPRGPGILLFIRFGQLPSKTTLLVPCAVGVHPRFAYTPLHPVTADTLYPKDRSLPSGYYPLGLAGALVKKGFHGPDRPCAGGPQVGRPHERSQEESSCLWVLPFFFLSENSCFAVASAAFSPSIAAPYPVRLTTALSPARPGAPPRPTVRVPSLSCALTRVRPHSRKGTGWGCQALVTR